ncbi:hypothetical protein B0T16DRAFT_114864 [Cercophora newfieldiana]|uniref:Uncharacterized protein n=1 Tax=Cercophora newfieldiana TaxID=92897 RepID=A0AA39YC68_9PEZI|nr:hypothetical protein B0T16DRAFT_114864 [Cercophora newfieldiana]
MVLHNIYSEEVEEATKGAMEAMVEVAPTHLKAEGRELATRTANRSAMQSIMHTVSTDSWKAFMKKLIKDALSFAKKFYNAVKPFVALATWAKHIVNFLIHAFNFITGSDIPTLGSGDDIDHDDDGNIDLDTLTAPAPHASSGMQFIMTSPSGRRLN